MVFVILVACVFAFVGLQFIVIGLIGIVTKRPVIFQSKTSKIVVVSAVLISQLFLNHENNFILQFSYLVSSFIIFFIVIIFLERRQKYRVFGITDPVLRNSLLGALGKLNLPTEETIFGFNLPSIKSELTVSVKGKSGVATFCLKPRNPELSSSIVKTMRTSFEKGSLPFTLKTFYRYLVAGLIFLYFGVRIFHFAKHFHNPH